MLPLLPSSTLFPYTTLFRSKSRLLINRFSLSKKLRFGFCCICQREFSRAERFLCIFFLAILINSFDSFFVTLEDRKSTRLNFSHLGISYAVFCLKKKIKNNN